MAITNAMTTIFKSHILQGAHNFRASGGHSFKIALYTSTATLDATATAYSTTNEVSGSGYTAGGSLLTNVSPVISGTTAYVSFSNVTWSSASITARGALVYNSTPTSGLSLTNPAVAVLDFGSDRTSSNGDFTVVFPTADATNAILRIA